MAKTGNQILTGIKRRVTVPASQPLLSDDDILAMVDDIVQSRLVPVIISMRQDFFVTTLDVPIIANQVDYDIPPRAVGRTLRDLKRKLADGNKVDMTLVGVEDEHFSALTGIPNQFYFKGDKVALSPMPSSTEGSIEMWYELMPSRITTTDNAAVVTSISGDDVSVTSVPSSLAIGDDIDFVAGCPGHFLKGMDKTITNIVGNVISFGTDEVPTTLAAGDYISPAGYTPVIQLPDECYPYLESETCYRMLQAISDYEGAKFLQADIEIELRNLKMLLEPRIRGEATKIIPRMGLARGARSRWKWGFLR